MGDKKPTIPQWFDAHESRVWRADDNDVALPVWFLYRIQRGTRQYVVGYGTNATGAIHNIRYGVKPAAERLTHRTATQIIEYAKTFGDDNLVTELAPQSPVVPRVVDEFWLVITHHLCVIGQPHDTYAGAIAECERLALTHGKRFFVAQIIAGKEGFSAVTDVQVSERIPF